MKIKNNFVMKNVAGSNVVVPTGEAMMDFNGMMTLNETGAFLWDKMQEDVTLEALAEAMCKEYEGITEEEAMADIKEFVATLNEKGVIDNG